MESPYLDYQTLVEEAGRHHGDICHGIRLGTRMTMSGLARIGIFDPKGQDKKKLLVFAEIDRCPTDAITAITGCRPGKRSMKVRDYGKMAATFINLETGRAVRIAAKAKGASDPDYAVAPEDELFIIREVTVPLKPEDLPGKSLSRTVCAICGEEILDGREVRGNGRDLCVPCAAGEQYYQYLP
ncbi:MAG: FmdE family protein [Desulfobulbaceae bacterium]|jgi:formylmethanofuran dehydrogenase subunit E|nr:FmdE family protein [Desulfobulbaceae bacterium]